MVDNSIRDQFTKLKKSFRFFNKLYNIGLICFLMLVLLGFSRPVLAAQYECRTEQAVAWRDGRLVTVNEHTFNGARSIITIDDQTSEFRIAVDKNSVFALMPFRVLKNDDYELLALYANENAFSTGSSFYMKKKDEGRGIIFMFVSMSQKAIFSGRCNIQ